MNRGLTPCELHQGLPQDSGLLFQGQKGESAVFDGLSQHVGYRRSLRHNVTKVTDWRMQRQDSGEGFGNRISNGPQVTEKLSEHKTRSQNLFCGQR